MKIEKLNKENRLENVNFIRVLFMWCIQGFSFQMVYLLSLCDISHVQYWFYWSGNDSILMILEKYYLFFVIYLKIPIAV